MPSLLHISCTPVNLHNRASLLRSLCCVYLSLLCWTCCLVRPFEALFVVLLNCIEGILLVWWLNGNILNNFQTSTASVCCLNLKLLPVDWHLAMLLIFWVSLFFIMTSHLCLFSAERCSLLRRSEKWWRTSGNFNNSVGVIHFSYVLHKSNMIAQFFHLM